MDSERLRTTVRYVCQDPVDNLRIRVTLARLSAATRGKAPAAPSSQIDVDAVTKNDQSSTDATTAHEKHGASIAPHPAITRVFGWQQKVYSHAELAAARELLAVAEPGGPQRVCIAPPGRAECLGSQQRPGTDHALLAAATAALREQQVGTTSSSTLFSYVHTDEFAARAEAARAVTTTPSESQNHLVRRLLQRRPRRQEQVPSARVMYLMADLGQQSAAGGRSERVLAALRAHTDGSLEVRPGFTAPGQRYRFEDEHGGIYEYSLEVVSRADPPRLELRAARLGASLLGGAGGGTPLLQGLRGKKGRALPPDLGLPASAAAPNALRLLLFGELVAGAGFDRDRLYIEWRLAFDPEIWKVVAPAQGRPLVTDEPGLVKGVTHVSRVVCYARDPLTNALPDWVAHWGHPLEVEWVAQTTPAPGDWPVLMLQVCSYDTWDRYTCEGYGWLQLQPRAGPTTAVVPTWKPMGTRRDHHAAYFIGGSPELPNPLDAARKRPSIPPADLLAAAYTTSVSGNGQRSTSTRQTGPAVLNRYGLLTQSSGSVKVRLHCLHQLGSGWEDAGLRDAAQQQRAPGKQQWASPSPRGRPRELSLAVVLERARARLEDARAGGGEVAVRAGVASAAPRVRRHPVDASVDEGATVHFSVSAAGGEPLTYRWLKDGRSLRAATADSADLILADVTGADAGLYACHVSNGDGEVTSDAAVLAVRRVTRLQRLTRDAETAGEAAASMGIGGGRIVPAGATPKLYNAAAAVLPLVRLGAAGRAPVRSGSSGDAARATGEGSGEGSAVSSRFARLRSRPAAGSAFSTGETLAVVTAAVEQEGLVETGGTGPHAGLAAVPLEALQQQQQQQQVEEEQVEHGSSSRGVAAATEHVAATSTGGPVGDNEPLASSAVLASSGSVSRVGSGAGGRRQRVSGAQEG